MKTAGKISDKQIEQAFQDAWKEFGDNKSTEFLINIAADRCKVSYRRVVNALQAVSKAASATGDVSAALAAERERAEKAEAERDEAQHLLIRCVNEGTDGFAGDDVSLEFFRGVPAECAGMKLQRDEFAALVREYAASETPEALATLERDRDRWAKRADRIERERDEARRNLSIARSDGYHDGWRDACLASPLNVDRIERETMEQCAKVAVDYARDSAGFGDIPADPFAATKRAGEHIAAAILALKDGER